MKYTPFLCLAFYSLVNHTLAQEYRAHQYFIKEGIPNAPIYSLCEDKLGYLWIGSTSGLIKYDGDQFTTYTEEDGLINRYINEIAVDSKNNIWVATSTGISGFNGRTFVNFKVSPTEKEATANKVIQIIVVNDTVFFRTHKNKIGKIVNHEMIYPVLEFGKEIKAIVSLADTALVLYGEKLSLYSHGRIREIDDHDFANLYKVINVNNEALLSTEKGLYQLQENALKKVYPKVGARAAVYTEENDSFWVTTRAGLIKQSGDHFENGTHIKEIPSLIMEGIKDKEGNLWFATRDKGLWKISPLDFQKIGTTLSIENESVRSVLVTENYLWMGTFLNGVFLLDLKGQLTRSITYKDSKKNIVNAIRADGAGNVYVCTNGGIGIFTESGRELNWLDAESGLHNKLISDVVFHRNGSFYIFGLTDVISEVRKDTILYHHPDTNEGYDIRSVKLWEERDLILVGSYHGLYQFNISSGQYTKYPVPEISEGLITSIDILDENHVVAGVWGLGVVRIDVSTGHYDVMLDKKSGLFTNTVHFIKKENGFLWVGTDRGISKIELGDRSLIKTVTYYNQANGFDGVACNTNSFWMDEDIKLFGTAEGVFRYLNRPSKKPTLHRLHFDHIQTIDQSFSEVMEYPVTHYQASYPAGLKVISIQFKRVNKSNNQVTKYRYMLEGFDTKWSEPSTMNSVTFTNLSSGTYFFRVQATDGSGTWGEDELNYAFVILTPFYKTAWFISLSIILCLSLVFLAFYLRTNYRIHQALQVEKIRTEEQNKLRKEIGRDFHDDMGNELAKIINYVDMLRLSNGSPKTKPLLDKVEFSARHLYHGTKDFLWSLDASNNDLQSVLSNIRDFGEKLFRGKEIDFRIFNTIYNVYPLPQGFGREILLIFKEAMTNTFKHSNARNVNLYLDNSGTELYIILEDDGVGFNPEAVHLSGLRNITARAERIGASITFGEGVNKKGAKISFYVNIQAEHYV